MKHFIIALFLLSTFPPIISAENSPNIEIIYGSGSSPDIKALNYITDYEPRNEDGTVNIVIEIPAGTIEQWEVTQATGSLELEIKNGRPQIIQYIGCPGNLGMIPQTLSSSDVDGGGQPLDAIILGPQLERGSIVKVKLLGALKLLDKGQPVNKLIAVAPGTSLFSVDSLQQLDETFPGITDIIKTWFLYHKGSGKIISKGYGGPEEAKTILFEAIKQYSTHHPKKKE